MISLPNPTAKKVMTTEQLNQLIIYTTDDLKRAYSIDDEGTLYYTRINKFGVMKLDDWDFVDVDEMDEELTEIQNKLIAMNKVNETYFALN